MKTPKKLPYGISDFAKLIKSNYLFIDKTKYIEVLENLSEQYVFLLRPRRFGKSLWVSILQHYYGLEYKEQFSELFGSLYIGQQPTKDANTYLIVKFDFSRIDTRSYETTYEGFLNNVKSGIKKFFIAYATFFATKELDKLLTINASNQLLQNFFDLLSATTPNKKLFILIDEYDHFANELLAFRLQDFKDIVSGNGFVRKFYEVIKLGTGDGIVDRLFVTGVTPITLDSMTSGFNISTHLTNHPLFAKMLGFTEEEVIQLITQAFPNKASDILQLLPQLKKWYNGYRFYKREQYTMYNPDMILYFTSFLQQTGQFPEEFIDVNIATDYKKIRRLFLLQNPTQNYDTLKHIVETKTITGRIIPQFSFERSFNFNDFVSLLYYMGFLTIQSSWANITTFKIPNYVIEQLYLSYFMNLLKEKEQVPVETSHVQDAMIKMALQNDIKPFFAIIQNVLEHLSNRDYQNFDEKYIKVIIIATALLTDVYYVNSEREIKAGYIDILFEERQPFPVNSQYIFELKYLKKTESKHLAKTQLAAKQQLLGYIKEKSSLNEKNNLQAWTIVVVKDKLHLEKVN